MSTSTQILIVEDDQLQSEFLSLNLIGLGYNVIDAVDSGEKAIEAVKKYSPDLIFMDIFLNGEMDGISTANQIKNLTDTPVIYITVKDSDEIFNQAKNTSPYAYLLKPFTVRELQLITELTLNRYRAEIKMQSFHAHLTQAQQLGNMGSWEWNIINNDLIWSDQIFRIFGLEPQAFTPTYPAFIDRIHPDDKQAVIDSVNNAVADNIPYDIEHRVILADGTIRCVHEIGEVTYDNENNPLSMIGTVIDVTERKRAEKKIEYLAYYDELTDLANRRLLLDRLSVFIALSRRDKSEFAVLFIDLDGFKGVNDNYGHKAGDKLLQQVAKHLKEITREMDTVARIGGDEFVILINNLSSRDSAMTTAQKILSTINKPYVLHNEISLKISASIGIAIYPDDGQNSDDLLSNSDNAMYTAKNEGKNRICFYDNKT